MKAHIHKLWIALLGLLGFSSCDWLPIFRTEYGCPHADYTVLSRVTDEDDNPIEDIKISVLADRKHVVLGPSLSNMHGELRLSASSTFLPEKLSVAFEDIDGEKNGGQFKADTVDFRLRQVAEGDNRWYEGRYEGEVNVRLKKEEK